jgi:hypothetical protein
MGIEATLASHLIEEIGHLSLPVNTYTIVAHSLGGYFGKKYWDSLPVRDEDETSDKTVNKYGFVGHAATCSRRAGPAIPLKGRCRNITKKNTRVIVFNPALQLIEDGRELFKKYVATQQPDEDPMQVWRRTRALQSDEPEAFRSLREKYLDNSYRLPAFGEEKIKVFGQRKDILTSGYQFQPLEGDEAQFIAKQLVKKGKSWLMKSMGPILKFATEKFFEKTEQGIKRVLTPMFPTKDLDISYILDDTTERLGQHSKILGNHGIDYFIPYRFKHLDSTEKFKEDTKKQKQIDDMNRIERSTEL